MLLAPRYLEGTLLHIIKPLYRIAKARELDISTLTYDPCLLVINSNADNFSIFRLKLKTMLTLDAQLDFNSYTLIIDASNIDNYKATLNLKQKEQGGKIKLIDINAPNRALRYIPITLINAKLIVFVDSSFANNKDLSSQLGFILMLINKSINSDNTFTICGNIIHYSLTKCKRVTRSVLASKIYSMRLSLPAVPLVICIDLYSLYECLINGKDNPADAFIKVSLNRALERFVNSNKVIVQVKG
ncbi:hypothetical protein BU23DRAFT_580860 [Bimuria novae-zelandiae CBS 107.79]|uniref:Uncharacterized protein n=1 Tax=Bimuria novae-zelandiae CBS 107.79 TaxID=1447943 RepID=A0A6A5V6I2_9PLEO|nr:hypothetical protein BU23DRAFT_580860 [Bimuria novae-zelandiae CBS 107.79]